MIENQIAIYISLIFLAFNFFAFFVMLSDKIKSVNSSASRISEGLLFFVAVVFGSFGVYAGMFVFRHKTRKWYFLLGIPLLMLQNLASVYLVYLFLINNY